MEKLIVVVGDIHGCIEEFDELLNTIQYNSNQMRLILLGDLMDRGPDPIGCVRRARELGVECVKGNHEEKHIRWRKHIDNYKLTGKANPMRPMSAEDQAANEALSDDDMVWMKNLPLKLHLKYEWWAVHAGCEPRYTLEKQNPSQIMRVRYVNDQGAAVALNPDKSQPEGTVYWDMLWQGPQSIIYGHCVHDLQYPRFTHGGNDTTCLGIDTGCCFGGHLTAALMKDYVPMLDGISPMGNDLKAEYVQIKAKQKYYVGYGDE